MSVKCGVPKRSTLGLILFSPYITNLCSEFNKSITIHFAYDIHLRYTIQVLSTTESVISYENKMFLT